MCSKGVLRHGADCVGQENFEYGFYGNYQSIHFCRPGLSSLVCEGIAMNLHLLTGIGVLLLLVVVSAYRDALRNEAIGSFRAHSRKFPPADWND
jgi:hypothetical protein